MYKGTYEVDIMLSLTCIKAMYDGYNAHFVEGHATVTSRYSISCTS